jgi:hypothetical protein
MTDPEAMIHTLNPEYLRGSVVASLRLFGGNHIFSDPH